MYLDCIRHGETPSNVANRFSGHNHEGLTADQAAALRAWQFAASGYDRIYSSPLTRCLETARCLRIDPDVADPRLAERHFGIFEGLTVDDCRTQFPEEFAALMRLEATFVIPGGESRAEHLKRLLEWLHDATRYGRVLAITHGGTIDFLYRLGTGLSPHGGRKVYAGANAAVSRFEVDWPDVRLLEYSVPIDRP